ncbi:hypothetical protein ACHQM5_007629 [Ranunculus cassubicifolius]
MADLHDDGSRKRKLAAVSAVSAAVTMISATAYITIDIPGEPHGKKMRNLKVVKDKIERMNVATEQISKSIDPMSLVNKLYSELMKVNGFSSEYLLSVFQILAKDHVEAEIFLARNVEFREKMLEVATLQISDLQCGPKVICE